MSLLIDVLFTAMLYVITLSFSIALLVMRTGVKPVGCPRKAFALMILVLGTAFFILGLGAESIDEFAWISDRWWVVSFVAFFLVLVFAVKLGWSLKTKLQACGRCRRAFIIATVTAMIALPLLFLIAPLYALGWLIESPLPVSSWL